MSNDANENETQELENSALEAETQELETQVDQETEDQQEINADEEQESETPDVVEPEPEQPAPEPVPEEAITTATGNGLSVQLNILLATFVDYVAAMAPELIYGAGKAANAQKRFFRGITKVLALPGEDFNKAMPLLIDLVRENRRGAFSERNFCRDMDSVQLNTRERLLFERFLRLLIVSADQKAIGSVQEYVDIPLVIESLDDNTKQKVLAFYQVN